MSNPITIKLFLASGRSTGIRTAEISNWSGMALAAPKTEFPAFLARPELEGSGVYFLIGQDPASGNNAVYIGEAETLRKRLPTHRDKDFWVQVVVFTSKDQNLSKAHIRYLEGRLISIAQEIGQSEVRNTQASGSKLSESDTADMEIFLSRIRQLLPVLGSGVLTPIAGPKTGNSDTVPLVCRIHDLEARGERTESGFVVFSGSQAVREDRPSAGAWSIELRKLLLEKGVLVDKGDHLHFEKDYEFSSPSAAAGLIRGGNTNGLTSWRHPTTGERLREIESGE